MSTTLRGILILVFTFAFVVIIGYQSLSNKSNIKRAYTFLLMASALFPFLDLGMTISGIQIKVYSVACTAFLIFNFTPIYRLAKKYYLILIYVIILLITSLASEFKSDSLSSIADKLRPAIVFLAGLIVFQTMDEKHRLNLFAKYMRMPIIMTVLFGLIQIFVNQYFSVFYSVWDKTERISLCYPDPQIAGCSAAMLTVYLWNKFLASKDNFKLVLMVFLTFVGLYTGSKVFLFGLFTGILISFIYLRQKTKYILVILIIVTILFVTQEHWSQLYIFERLSGANESLEGRQEVYWMVAIKIFVDNWATGIGSGVFQHYIEKYNIPMMHQQSDGIEVYASQPESGYLLWLDEIGVFASIYIIIILYFVFKKHGNHHINLSIVVPWLIAFVSLYNLGSNMLIYILFITLALMVVQTRNKQ